MKSEFASANLTAGQLNAIVKKLGGYDGALRFLRDEISLRDEASVIISKRKWREQDGIIYLSVTSNGMTGEDWIEHFRKNGFMLNCDVERVLRSENFKPSLGVTTEIAILKDTLWSAGERLTRNIRVKAFHLGITPPNVEVACLIREAFSDQEIRDMGLKEITVMHESFIDSHYRLPMLLNISSVGGNHSNCGSWLLMKSGNFNMKWEENVGFAFQISSVSA